MKLKSTQKRVQLKHGYKLPSLVITLVFTLLGSFGVLTPAQTTEATPIVGTTLGAVSTIIASVLFSLSVSFLRLNRQRNVRPAFTELRRKANDGMSLSFLMKILCVYSV